MSAEQEADLKLQTWLHVLPELYYTRSSYWLIVSITNFGVKNAFWGVLLNENICSTFQNGWKIIEKRAKQCEKSHSTARNQHVNQVGIQLQQV